MAYVRLSPGDWVRFSDKHAKRPLRPLFKNPLLIQVRLLFRHRFQSIKRSKLVWPEPVAFAGDWLRSSWNVAEWALKEPSYGAMVILGQTGVIASLGKFCSAARSLALETTIIQRRDAS